MLTAGHLRSLYRTAMRHELDFFDAAISTYATPRVGVLVLDFDETLTVSDSTSVVINTAIDAAETAMREGGCFTSSDLSQEYLQCCEVQMDCLI